MERMAKILYSHKKMAIIPTSDFVFHRCSMIDRFRVMHVYFDFKDLSVLVCDLEKGIHMMNLVGDNLHSRFESGVLRMAKFETTSTVYAGFTIVYWSGARYQTTPCSNTGSCAFKTVESTMTNKWQLKVVVKWPPASGENSDTMHINVCTDNYTITNDSLLRMADQTLISDFTHMQMVDPNIYSVQTLMLQNGMNSTGVFGKMNLNFAIMDAGTNMSEDLMAFTSSMETKSYLGLFDGVNLTTMFETFLPGKSNQEEEALEEEQAFSLLDEDMVMKLREMMDEESRAAIYETPAWERRSINAIIGDLVMKFQDGEMSIAFKRVVRLFKNVEGQEEADKVWSILATEIMLVFKGLEEFMARIVLVSVYKSVSRRIRVIPPKNVCIIVNYRMPLAPLITSSSIDEYDMMFQAI